MKGGRFIEQRDKYLGNTQFFYRLNDSISDGNQNSRKYEPQGYWLFESFELISYNFGLFVAKQTENEANSPYAKKGFGRKIVGKRLTSPSFLFKGKFLRESTVTSIS